VRLGVDVRRSRLRFYGLRRGDLRNHQPDNDGRRGLEVPQRSRARCRASRVHRSRCALRARTRPPLAPVPRLERRPVRPGASPGWTAPATIDSGDTIAGLSCSSPSLCVAVDSGGSGLTTTDPAGGAAAWNASTVIGGNNAFSGVSCAAGPFCVATTSTTTPSQFWVSFDPTGGAFAWQEADLAVPIYGVSCPSTDLCVAVDDIGNVLTSTNPNSGSPSVSITHATGPTLLSIACPTSTLCVATDIAGDVVTSVTPTGGAPAWTSSNVDGSEAILAVSCPTTTFCAAVDDAGDLLTSTNPAGGAGAWSSVNVDGDAFVAGISCSSPSFCVAVDDLGSVLVSTNPTGGAGAWKTAGAGPGNFLFAVSCVSDSLCVAVDLAGNVVTSTAPASAAPGWTSANVDNSPLTAVSCPSITMCVAVDGSGFEINSINPSGGADEWTGTRINTGSALRRVLPRHVGMLSRRRQRKRRLGWLHPIEPDLAGDNRPGETVQPTHEVHGTWIAFAHQLQPAVEALQHGRRQLLGYLGRDWLLLHARCR
jgi:hypothetical protein